MTGDWVLYAIYRQADCGLGIGEEKILVSGPVVLLPPRPNPFTDAARLEFQLEREGHVALDVYDLAGRKVADLLDRSYPSGRHVATWDGRLADGSDAPSGVYFAVLKSGGSRSVQKIVRTR